jgi:flagellar biosynthesis/type III secretory pathway M-ring protein FliF/YscJ
MSESLYGLVEMLLFFGVLLAFLIWQLVVTRRSLRNDRERAQRETRGATPNDRTDPTEYGEKKL